MLNPISFIWRQFNGPQISAICQALFNYFKKLCDENLDYFNDFTLDTANSEHLSLLGVLQGLARPLVPIPDEELFWFEEPYEYTEGNGMLPELEFPGHKVPVKNFPSLRGFAEGPVSEGGVFSEEKDTDGNYKNIPDYIFRQVLKSNTASEGRLGGLVVLDDILVGLFQKENPGFTPIHKFTWNNDIHTGTPGDIHVDLGVSGDWVHPYEVFAEIKELGNTIYFPIPRLFAHIAEGDSQLDPTGFVHILIESAGSTYGLDAMWAGEGTPSDIIPDGESPAFSVEPITVAMLNAMWQTSQTWIDEPSPAYFKPLTPEEIANLW